MDRDAQTVADPSAETFYAVNGPVLLDFVSTDGMTETVSIKDKVSISNPAHVREAEKYVGLGVLSKTPSNRPAKDED